MFLNKRAKKVIYLKLPCSFCLTPKYLIGNEKQAIMTIPIADKHVNLISDKNRFPAKHN